MNRIKLSPLASATSNSTDETAKDSKSPLAAFAFDQTAPRSVHDTTIFAPLHYEKNYRYPLIIWLHSDGQSSSQLESTMLKLSVQNYVGVAPQAPIGNFHCGYFWEQDFDSIQTASDTIADSIDQITNRFNINPQRIFLAGSGGGGTMALRIGLQQPDQFAGVISLNGPLPEGFSPLAQWPNCREMPIFWSHCLQNSDDVIDMCEQFRFLYASGFLNVTACEYPTLESLEKFALQGVNKWIMEQIDSAIL